MNRKRETTTESKTTSQVKCPIWDKLLSHKRSISDHIRTHTGEKPYKCDQCGVSFGYAISLKYHIHQIHLGVKFHTMKVFPQCCFCDKTFQTDFRLQEHLRRHLGERHFFCKSCPKTFFTSAELGNHISYIHSDKRKFSCELCNKKFKTKSDVSKHLHTHTTERPHQCDECKKNFKTKSNLTQHRKTHVAEKTHVCELCHKRFKLPGALHSHIQTHTGEKPYKCDKCAKTFPSNTKLASHQLVHTSVRAYQCLECDESFKSLKNRQKHWKRLHSSREPALFCVFCRDEKRFWTKAELHSHLRSHVKEKVFICKECGNEEKISARALEHRLWHHTNKRPYTCANYSKYFSSWRGLLQHKKTMHS